VVIQGFVSLLKGFDMSNEMIGLVAGVVGVIAFVSWYVFAAIRGVTSSLVTAKVGEIYNFDYEQPHKGESRRVLAKVVEPVYSLEDYTIRRLNAISRYRRNDPEFKRTKHLVTCEMPNGDIRNFYVERTKNVRKCVFSNRLFRTAVAAML